MPESKFVSDGSEITFGSSQEEEKPKSKKKSVGRFKGKPKGKLRREAPPKKDDAGY